MEVLFSMSVGLRPGLHKNYCADFHETWTKDGSRLRIEPIKFPCGSGWRDRADKCFVSYFNVGRKPPVRRQPVSMSEHTRRLMVLGEGLLVYFRIFISSCIFIFALQLSFKAKRGTVGRDEAETVFGGGKKKKKDASWDSLWLLEVINSVPDQKSNLNPRLYSLAVSALHLPHPARPVQSI